MRNIILITAIMFYGVSYSHSQNFISVRSLHPTEKYENIHVQTLYSDSLSSSYMIWVRKEVKPHKHVYHTEQVYVLEGNGEMIVDDEKHEIQPGDIIFIPKNTVHSVEVWSELPMKVISVQSPEFHGKDRIFVDE